MNKKKQASKTKTKKINSLPNTREGKKSAHDIFMRERERMKLRVDEVHLNK